MPEQNRSYKVITILCEGESEVEYISKLQAYLESLGIFDIKFVKRSIGGGTPTLIKRAIKLQRTKQRNHATIYIWIDEDIYIRNSNNQRLEIKNCKFWYNHVNFEDFLILHSPEEVVIKWQNLCAEKGHFKTPFTWKEYEKLLQQYDMLAGYKKGEFPKSLKINKDTLEMLFKNQNNQEIKFKSDLVPLLQEIFLKQKVNSEQNTPVLIE